MRTFFEIVMGVVIVVLTIFFLMVTRENDEITMMNVRLMDKVASHVIGNATVE